MRTRMMRERSNSTDSMDVWTSQIRPTVQRQEAMMQSHYPPLQDGVHLNIPEDEESYKWRNLAAQKGRAPQPHEQAQRPTPQPDQSAPPPPQKYVCRITGPRESAEALRVVLDLQSDDGRLQGAALDAMAAHYGCTVKREKPDGEQERRRVKRALEKDPKPRLTDEHKYQLMIEAQRARENLSAGRWR